MATHVALRPSAPSRRSNTAGILIDNGKSWFTSDFEGDTRMGGKATLAIMPLTWKSGWPEVEVVDECAGPYRLSETLPL
jgi:hypothetical protein